MIWSSGPTSSTMSSRATRRTRPTEVNRRSWRFDVPAGDPGGQALLTQHVGRILRDQPGKDIAEVRDELDAGVPLLAAMYRRRRPGYKELGFTPGSSQSELLPNRDVAEAASARASDASDREPTAPQVRA